MKKPKLNTLLLSIIVFLLVLIAGFCEIFYRKLDKWIEAADNSKISKKRKECDEIKKEKDIELKEWYNINDEDDPSMTSMLLDSKIIYNKELDSCIWAYKRMVTYPENHKHDEIWYMIQNYSRGDEILFGCTEKNWESNSYSDAKFNKKDLSLSCEERWNKRIDSYRD